MFFGGLAENKPEIKVPDVEPQAFLTLLKYDFVHELLLTYRTLAFAVLGRI